jgi:hypothetical protein
MVTQMDNVNVDNKVESLAAVPKNRKTIWNSSWFSPERVKNLSSFIMKVNIEDAIDTSSGKL